MKGLSPEARELLRAAQEADEPTASERRRGKRALMAATLAASAASGASSAAAATGGITNLFAGLGLAQKVALIAGAVAMTGAAAPKLVNWAHTSEPAPVLHATRLLPPVTSPGVESPTVIEPADVESPAVIESAAVASPEPAPHRRPLSLRPPGHTPSNRRVAAASTLETRDARPTEQPAAPSDLRGELLLLARAQRARAHGDPAAALASLREHARRFPHGQLSAEREAARVLALRALGRDAEANLAQARFLRHHSDSPLATIVGMEN